MQQPAIPDTLREFALYRTDRRAWAKLKGPWWVTELARLAAGDDTAALDAAWQSAGPELRLEVLLQAPRPLAASLWERRAPAAQAAVYSVGRAEERAQLPAPTGLPTQPRKPSTARPPGLRAG